MEIKRTLPTYIEEETTIRQTKEEEKKSRLEQIKKEEGEKEIKENKFALRTRGKKELEMLSKSELIAKLKKLQGVMPWRALPMPALISERPIFVG